MIQVFLISFNSFKKNRYNYKICLSIFILTVLIIVLYRYHLKDTQKLIQLLNNIFQFSGIYSALLITFIVSKIFQIRQEKLERLREIIVLSHKTTDFRRICEILVESYDFWNKDMRQIMDGKFKKLTYFQIHLDEDSHKKLTKDRIDEYHNSKNIVGSGFYLAVKSLIKHNDNPFQMELYDEYDYNIDYSVDILNKWVSAYSANCFFNYLEHKKASYKGAFDFSAIDKNDKEKIISLSKKINEKKYKKSVFNPELLVQLGNDFNSLILPRLFQLTYNNKKGLPKSLKFLILILIVIMIFGVFLPLILSAIRINDLYLILLSSFSIIILSFSILYFVIYFKKILENEIEISRENI